jgi:hypothetical protein
VELGAAEGASLERGRGEAAGLPAEPDAAGAADPLAAALPEGDEPAGDGAPVGTGDGRTDGVAVGSGITGSVATSDTTWTSSRKS